MCSDKYFFEAMSQVFLEVFLWGCDVTNVPTDIFSRGCGITFVPTNISWIVWCHKCADKYCFEVVMSHNNFLHFPFCCLCRALRGSRASSDCRPLVVALKTLLLCCLLPMRFNDRVCEVGLDDLVVSLRWHGLHGLLLDHRKLNLARSWFRLVEGGVVRTAFH